ncbi:MAG: NAD(P)-dependent oxidoreductase [Gemmataceae bacterium]
MNQLATAANLSAISSEHRLDDLLSEPPPAVVETMGRLTGDLIVLGVAGKMGPSLARMAKRASDAAGVRRRVIGVSRFSAGDEAELGAHGVETVRCDLLADGALARLPDAANVLYLAARKFGSTGDEATTWAINSHLPGTVCRRYRGRRIVALSTGNVYRLVPADGGGSREDDPPEPVGEYAMSCLGRERVFEFFSRTDGTPVALIRLFYACDLRYGVLVDVARRVLAGEPVDLTTGYFNTIWQGDANAMILQAFDRVASPPWVVNVSGPERLAVRDVATRFGTLLGRPVRFTGTESETALLSNPERRRATLGTPRVTADELIEWVGAWVGRGGRCLGKPTHFEARDGRY